MLGTVDSLLLWTNLGISLLVLVAASYLGLSLKQALLATLVGALGRQHDARPCRIHRRRCARAGDGIAARAARAARLVHRDRAQRAPVPRLVGLRDHDHRVRRGRALGAADRRPTRLDVEAFVRRARARARAARPGRLRAALRPQDRDLGGRCVDRLSRDLDPPPRRPRRPLARAGKRRLVLARRRPRDRADGLVGAARRGLHALLAHASLGVHRRRHWLSAADALPVRLRCGARALASVDRRADRRADDRRRGRGRRDPRAARAHGGRDRRGVREHLLDRGVAAEPRAAGIAAVADRRRRDSRHRDLARRRT